MRKSVIIGAAVLAGSLLFSGCTKMDSGYRYADPDSYSSGDFSYDESSVEAVEINWIAGNVYIDESVMDILQVYEESEQDINDSGSLRYKIEDGTLVIQFCESGSDIDNMSKDLYVKLPILLKDVDINVVSADIQMVSSAADIQYDSVSGKLDLAVDQCEDLTINTVSGDLRILLDYDLGAKVEFDSVSGKYSCVEKTADKICNVKCHTVSGNLDVVSE